MLQTDEIEEDYFTPASSTTLANIFGKKTDDRKTENESLKYTPPKPQNIAPKPEESKATQCVFACALYGYEWSNNIYTSKGKLGFAIIKIIKTGYHNVVLYDSNKTTLSCATVSPALEITVKSNVYVSYFDNMQKYWSLYSTEDEVKRMVDILKDLNAVIKHSSDTDKGPPIPLKQGNITKPQLPAESETQMDRESDTDSSINKRTKQSILNRMANMGHSVLPPNTLTTEKTSDSSDTNENDNYTKVVTRHKIVKGGTKRNSSDKNLELQSFAEAHKTSLENSPALYTSVGGQLVPVTSNNLMTGPSSSPNEMNMFISEQRVNNTEMRINMTRVTDKVDQVLEKLSGLTHKDTNNVSSNFQMEILQKLLNEYETKIKVYEDIINSKGIDKHANVVLPVPSNEIESLNNKLLVAMEENKEKHNRIFNLESELNVYKDKCKNDTELESNISKLLQEKLFLKQELENKNKEIDAVTQKLNSATVKSDSDNTVDIVKNILNDTFHAISANFENNEEYRGEAIKSIVANVIKRAYENLKQEK